MTGRLWTARPDGISVELLEERLGGPDWNA